MKLCSVDGCDKKHNARGLCRNHYEAWQKRQPAKKFCSIEGCGRRLAARGFCRFHYKHYMKTGDPLLGGVVLGKTWLSDKGYVMTYAPGHPNAQSQGHIPEHVLVITRHIGRPLGSGETIHHKNGVRHDNRVENLEVWSTRHPVGTRVEDLKLFAAEIVQTYGLVLTTPAPASVNDNRIW